MSNPKTFDFECDECDRSFKTKQGMNQHKTKMHRKADREENMKRMRSEEKQVGKIKCKNCAYECKSEFALKTHKSHAHKELSSPENKKQKTDETEKGSDIEMKTIEPTQEFLTKTAITLAEALDDIQDRIDDDRTDDEEDEDLDDGELTRRLLALKDTGKPKCEDDYLVTLPIKDVEELRVKLLNSENKVEELTVRLEKSEARNKNLLEKVEELKCKKPDTPKIELPEWLKPKFQCEHCKKRFLLESNLLKHIPHHNLPNPSENVSPAEDPRPEVEARSEEENRPKEDARSEEEVEYKCHTCGGMFPSEEEVKGHIERRHREVEQNFPCTDCNDFVADSEETLNKHKKYACKDFTCMECDYQTNTDEALAKHMSETHHNVKSPKPKKKCYSCEEGFGNTKDLMKHRKEIHPSNIICRYFSTDKGCNYGDECIYVHEVKMVVGDSPTPGDVPTPLTPAPVSSTMIVCKICNEQFNSKHNLMSHRKQKHIESVKQCRDHLQNTCRRGEGRCWYKHESFQQPQPQRVQGHQNFVQNQQVQKTPVHTQKQQQFMMIMQQMSELFLNQ